MATRTENYFICDVCKKEFPEDIREKELTIEIRTFISKIAFARSNIKGRLKRLEMCQCCAREPIVIIPATLEIQQVFPLNEADLYNQIMGTDKI